MAHLHPELLPRLHVLAFGSPRWAASQMLAHFARLFGQRALNLVTVGTAHAQQRSPLLSPPSTPLPGWWVETREAKVRATAIVSTVDEHVSSGAPHSPSNRQ